MYSLHLSPEQLQIRDTVRDFVAREIKPLALEPARLEASARPLLLQAIAKASHIGLRTLALSEDLGGASADNLTCCIVTEELAVGDADVAAVLAQTATVTRMLFENLMTPEQRARFLPAFLADHRHHIALAEHQEGRDASLGINYHRPQASGPRFSTVALRTGDEWIINGRKDRVVGASIAALFVVRASMGGDRAATLLVSRNTPGLTVTADEASRRWRHGACGTLIFENCRVPAENRLAADAALFPDEGRRIPQEEALALGIGRAAFEAALDYAQLRVQGGRRIIEHQAIGAKLAEIAARLEVARAAIWQAAWASDHPDAFADRSLPDLPLTTIAAVFASEAIHRAGKDAAECFGAMGVMRDMPLHKYVQDARICLHSGMGSSEAKLRIAEALARYRRPASAAVLAAE
jgi:butyryl-CoA dehydrogenase